MTNDELLLRQDEEELYVKNQRAMFYQVLAKPDSITKVYNKTATVDVQDISELNDRISEKLTHYRNAGYIIQTNVKFSNGKTRSFPDWRAFSSHDWHESEAISNIVITWTFNALFPDSQKAEKHTLMMKLSNGLRPEEMLNLVFTGKIEEIEEMDNNLFPIVARVDFVDRTLAEELLFLVGEWVKGLRDSGIEKSKFVLFLKKNKGKVTSVISWITNLIIMCTSVFTTGEYIKRIPFKNVGEISSIQVVHIIYAIFICAAFWIFGKKIVGNLTDVLFEKLRLYGENALFNITKGDKNKQLRLIKQERKNKISIIWNLVVSIGINIICGLIVNFLS